MGGLPDGLASPNKISAMACPDSVPRNQVSIIAETCVSIGAKVSGRPFVNTSTMGLFNVASISMSSICTPRKSIFAWDDDSPLMTDDSPTASIKISACSATFNASSNKSVESP
jgi:hypothetical protein